MKMSAKLVMGLAVLLMLSPALSQGAGDQETSQVLKKLEMIEQRLNRIEAELRSLRQGPSPRGGMPPGRSQEPPNVREDAAEIWRAMGDPKELAKRLDSLIEAVSPTIADPEKRDEFLKDGESLKQLIASDVSFENLLERVRRRFSERLEKSRSDREKAWLEGELKALGQEGPDRQEKVDRYLRIENLRALHEFAAKHSISREQMVKHGLAFIGFGGRSPGDFRRPDGERTRRGDPPSSPRRSREERR